MEAHHTSFFFNQYTPGGRTELVDVNGDGFKDILFANTDAQDFAYWQNNGDGTFQDLVRYGAGHEVYDLVAGDFNNDGQLDVAMSAEVDDGPWFYAGVVIIDGKEQVSGGPAVVTGLDVTTGALLSGGIAELQASDDAAIRTRSGFGQTFIDLHHMEMVVHASTNVPAPSTLELMIEDRIDHPAGTAQIRLRNWNTGQFESVGSYPLGPSDAVHVLSNIDAANFVSGSGAIDVSIKHIVFVPFLAFTFESFIDHVQIDVR
jgi:hypothetical protein